MSVIFFQKVLGLVYRCYFLQVLSGITLAQGQDNLFRGQDNLIRRQDHLNRGQDHLIRGQDRLSHGQDHLIQGQGDIIRGQDHLAQMVSLCTQGIFVTPPSKFIKSFSPRRRCQMLLTNTKRSIPAIPVRERKF